MDQKQQKFNFIKNINQQQQSLVELRPKGNNPTKYEAAAAKFVFPAKDEAHPKATRPPYAQISPFWRSRSSTFFSNSACFFRFSFWYLICACSVSWTCFDRPSISSRWLLMIDRSSEFVLLSTWMKLQDPG